MASLFLMIGDAVYNVDRMPAEKPVTIAWSVRRWSVETPYHVHADAHGLHCDCPDFHWRGRENQPVERSCKHVRALLELGLLPGWKPQPPSGPHSEAK